MLPTIEIALARLMNMSDKGYDLGVTGIKYYMGYEI